MLKSIFKNHLLFLSGLMLIAASNAQAHPGCDAGNTVAECQEPIRIEQERLRELQAGQAPSFLDIARNGDGSVKRMTQPEAIEYCANQGAHLPSARELVQLSMSFGARGIVDSCSQDNQCYRILATNAEGSQDEFYFSYAGYQRPVGDLGNNWFWSSSVFSLTHDYAFSLYGDGGEVDYDYRYDFNAVRCVAGR